MPYARTQVRQALLAAKDAGKDCTGLSVDSRETPVMLEKWGFLPIDQDAVDERVRDWYVRNGLATPLSDTPKDAPGDTRERGSTAAALEAAEAALVAASAALRLAKSLSSRAAA